MLPILTSMVLSLSLTFSAVPGHGELADNKPSDADITYWTHYALSHDPRTLTSEISVETRDGIVKLSGVVDNLASQNFAIAEAKKVRGVRGVIDGIDVVPVHRPDEQVAREVVRRLENSMAVDARSLVVDVHEGVVTLSGELPDWNQREEARALAAGVRGVKDVVDKSDIHRGEGISDERLAAESRERLRRDAYLSELPISVAVDDGVITVTGTVGNLYEKERAGRRLLWQYGVRSVNNELEVEPWENYGVRNAAPEPSDAELKRTVREELETDLRLTPDQISVDAVAGHVMLFGSVPSLRQKRIAETDTRDVVGVAWVTNELVVYPTYREDSGIRDQVIFNLGTDPHLSKVDIGVSVEDGVVTLTGAVPDLYQKHRATDLAVDVMGVRRVVNEMTVSSTPKLTDAVLKRMVTQRLEEDWKVAWIYEDIGVKVDGETVTLTGDVNSWSEREEAGRVALHTQGVLAVDNRITVRGVSYPWDQWHSKLSGYFELYDPYDIYYPPPTVEK
jgi:osmotically-inducible protein OsmY